MKYVIIANGPFLPKSILEEATAGPETVIIALDGAADKLAKYGIMPHMINGDFDSMQHHEFWGIPQIFLEKIDGATKNQECTNKNGIHIVYTPDQSATDLSKAIKLCDTPLKHFKQATEIHVLCALDGRPDHSIGNLGVLKTHYNPKRPLYLHTDAYTLQFVKDSTLEVIPPSKDKHHFAIMGAPSAAYISDGLQWNGKSTAEGPDTGPDGYKVYPGHDSTCNLMNEEGKKAEIKITGSAFIMRPGMLKNQRLYTKEDNTVEISKLYEQIDMLNRTLLTISEEELHQLNTLRKLVKQKLQIKAYSEAALKEPPKHTSRTYRLREPSAANNRYYFLSIPVDKQARLKSLKGHTEQSVNDMDIATLKKTFPNFSQ